MLRVLRMMLTNRFPLAATVLFSAALGGCHTTGASGAASAALVPVQTCGQGLDFVRQVALARMNQQIDEQLASFAKGERCYGYGRGEGDLSAATGVAGGAPPPMTAPTTSGPDKATNASGTNNQVAGVDEADFVKNDGKYIYLAQNGVLRIIDAYPGPQAQQLSSTTLDGTPRKLFVDGDRALVYVSVPDPRTTSPDGKSAPSSYGGGRECTYGYDCDFTGDGTSTKLEIFDLTDRASPKKVREIFLSGSLIAARRIGTTTHTVVADNLQLFPELQYYPNENLCDYQQAQQPTPTGLPSDLPAFPPSASSSAPPFETVAKASAAYEALRVKNRQIILGKDLSGILPRLGDDAFGGSTIAGGTEVCDGLFRAQLLDGASFTTVVSVDMSATQPAKTVSIVSSPGAVYASEDALFMAVPSERSYGGVWYDGYRDVEQLSSLHKFRISSTASDTRYVGSGIVNGRVLNQFAMDERDAFLRVATTSGRVPDPNVESQLTIFAEANGSLNAVGRVEHLAPKEDIRSVRFDGTRGFIVTFKKTDPLFVLDLANPTAPKLVGELKIPGFSTYLHMLDDNHLLSIGYDANDHDSFAFFNGVLLQIFDVTDPTNPTLAQRYSIGTRGSSSEALTNHLAFNYFAPLQLLAVPMTICEGGGDGKFGDQLTFSGLMLFDIDAAAGITEHGRVAYPTPDLTSAPYAGNPSACSNWWTNATSDVKRSIFMDRWVYSISDQLLKVQSVDKLGTDLQSIDLAPSASTSP